VRSNKTGTADISLQAIATVEADKAISVRWHCDAGEIET
jgi:hypothetical protein